VRITLEELKLHRIVVSKSYPAGEINYGEAEFRQSSALKIDVTAELAGAEIRIRGHVATTLDGHCDRCLCAVTIPVDQSFDIYYRPASSIAREEEIKLPDDELDVGFFEGDGIELAEIAKEQVILSLPMKNVCRDDCRGLCPVCRVNLNLEQCGCRPANGSSPFSQLT
jgi:uncharacterized protein